MELKVEDGLGLDLAEPVARHQRFAGRRGRGRAADERDDFVEMVERDDEAFEDVRALLGLLELEDGAPPDDVPAEIDEEANELEEREDLGPVVDDGEDDDAEAGLELRCACRGC